MKYIKHPVHGNRHVSDEEAAELEDAGWVVWPRTRAQKSPPAELVIPVLARPVLPVDPPAVKKAPKKANILTGE